MLRNAPPRAINLPRAPLAATPPYRALTARPILCHVQESDPGAAPALPDPFLLDADADLASCPQQSGFPLPDSQSTSSVISAKADRHNVRRVSDWPRIPE